MKKMFLSLLLCMLALTAGAYDFAADYTFEVNYYESDGSEGGGSIPGIAIGVDVPYGIEVTITLYYNINPDGSSVSVTSGPSPYSDTYISFPATVKHDGKTYAVTAIGQSAFEDSSIGYVNIPDNIKEIGVSSFSNCKQLSQVRFSNNLKSIPEYAFQWCGSLREIILPKGLESISDYAFASCGAVSVSLPSTLTSLGNYSFCYLMELPSIEIPAGITTLPDNCFFRCYKLKEVKLNEGIRSIGSDCFNECHTETVNFPEGLETIGSQAFYDCKMKKVVLPNSVTTLGSNAFDWCDSLRSITFSTAMEYIPYGLCGGCKSLNNVVIPSNIKRIGANAFMDCSGLSNVQLHDDVYIEYGAFMGTGLVKFTFPVIMESIPGGILSDCKDLQEVYIGDNVKEISESMFRGCVSLKKVRLSERLTSLPNYCFSGCSTLESITIPNSVKTLGEGCFYQCAMLDNVVIPDSVITIDRYCFDGCKSLKNIKLSENLESLGDRAFTESAIESISLPSKTKYVGSFESCPNLQSITMPYSVEGIYHTAFAYCPNLKEVHLQRPTMPALSNAYGYVYGPIIPADNMATLYVPRGASELYKSDKMWNAFHEIVEEDVPDVYYQLTYETKSGRGSVLVNDEPIEYDRTMLLLNTGATVKFVPETTGWASSSYLIDHVLLNGNDITSELVDGVYTISNVETNYYFEAYYRSAPLTLHILNGAGGSVDLNVEKGESITFTVVPDDGWTVSSVFFNGTDCTSEILCGNKVTTYAITDEATISVTLEDNNGDAMVNSASWNGIKAFALHNSIHVTGVETAMPITIYSADGKEIRTVSAQSGETIINGLNADNTYIVKVGSKTFKLYL